MNQLCFCKLIRRHFNIMLFCYVNDGNKTLSRMNQSIMRQTAQSSSIVCHNTTGDVLMNIFNLDIVHCTLSMDTLNRLHPRFSVQTECFWKFHTREPSQPYILIIPQTQKIRQRVRIRHLHSGHFTFPEPSLEGMIGNFTVNRTGPKHRDNDILTCRGDDENHPIFCNAIFPVIRNLFITKFPYRSFC